MPLRISFVRTNIQKSFNEFNPACVYGYALVSLSPITYIKNPTQICASRRGKKLLHYGQGGQGHHIYPLQFMEEIPLKSISILYEIPSKMNDTI